MDILNGVRVIECAGEIAGPYCTKLFADAGAEVVKIEPPLGDPFRARASRPLGEREDGALFKFLNVGKHSVIGAVDDAYILDLITTADVFVEALGPGAIDHAKLLERRPVARDCGLVGLRADGTVPDPASHRVHNPGRERNHRPPGPS